MALIDSLDTINDYFVHCNYVSLSYRFRDIRILIPYQKRRTIEGLRQSRRKVVCQLRTVDINAVDGQNF